jgi:exosortase/archaeosortase family protein
MGKTIVENIRIFFTDERWEKVRAVFWFCLITIVIHFGWRFWAIQLHSWPLYHLMLKWSDVFVDMVYKQSTWFISHVLHIPITKYGYVFMCQNGFGLEINDSCSGIKQIMQFVILMLVFPGPWKHKTWFIPLGVVIVHLTNVLRIIILAVVAANSPGNIKSTHDSYMRIMFYVVIFALWLLWVEKISVKKPVKS